MHCKPLIESLTGFPKTLRAYLVDVDDAAAHWQPQAQDASNGSQPWSILQIVCHLIDEEALDFHVRLRLTLQDPANPWPGIDPERTARERCYQGIALLDAVQQLASRRNESMDWLRSLESPDFDRAYTHPQIGPIRAGDLLAAWAAHDHFHLRQIIKRRIQWLSVCAHPYSIDYAGGAL